MANLVLKNNTSGGKTSVTADNFVGNASTASKWLTARTITIGNTGKSVNGSGNVSWSLSEIGAAAASHTHSYLPLSGGNLTGLLTISLNGNTTTIGSQNSSWCHIYNSADARFIFNKDVVTIGAFAIYQCDSKGCGSSFPGSPILGQIFYKI